MKAVESVSLDLGLYALDMSKVIPWVLGYFGLCFTVNYFEFNAEESSVGFLVGEDFFKGEYLFLGKHEQILSNKQ